jgi:Domain of unknown function (DUF4430)
MNAHGNNANRSASAAGQPPLRSRRWRLPMMLALLLLVILLFRSTALQQNSSTNHGESAADDATAAATGKTVTLAIEFADGTLQHDYLPWREGMTVENLLAAAARLPKGIQFAQQGSGESALLTEINGTANEGGAGRNWTYSVNGQEADRSFAIYQLQPNDHVLWTFSTKQ